MRAKEKARREQGDNVDGDSNDGSASGELNIEFGGS